jgi:hypothetical protein
MSAADVPDTKLIKHRSTTPPAVLCLEGDWGKDPLDILSVEPPLRLLEMQRYMRLAHRNVNTIEELTYHISGMSYRKKPRYEVLYLAFHGSKEGIEVGERTVSLQALAEELRQQEPGFVVYFAACAVLKADAAELMAFCRNSGARAVAGYARDVDWTESAAFELLMLSSLLVSSNIKPLHDRLLREHPILTSKLGFRMAHRTWASDLVS